MSTAPPPAAPGHRALPIIGATRRLLCDVDRSMALVNPALVETFKALATGAAPWPLFLFGATGAGKTLAALAFADRVSTAAYFTLDQIGDVTMDGDRERIRDMWGMIREKELIVIDELGSRGQAGDLAYSSLRRVLDTREQHCRRSGIFISNLPPRDLAAMFDDRIGSRLLCGTRFELRGADRRLSR